ncbi:MAG: prolyl oligopeptidase family serine peptidase [Pseudomonadota bacterium]
MDPPPLGRRAVDPSHPARCVSEAYEWLRDPQSPKVQAQIAAENASSAAQVSALSRLRTEIYDEIVERLALAREDLPARRGAWLYYSETTADSGYPVHRRRPADGVGEPETVLDERHLAEGTDYLSISQFRVSPDHRLCAYLFDTKGEERHLLGLVEIATGRHVVLARNLAGSGLAWFADSRHLAVAALDDLNRPDRIKMFPADASEPAGRVVVSEPDPAFRLTVAETESGAYLVVLSAALDTTELAILDAQDPSAVPRILHRRTPGHHVRATHVPPSFFLLDRSAGHPDRLFRLPEADIGRPPDLLQEAAPNDAIEAIFAFQDFLAVRERQSGQAQLRILPADGSPAHSVALPMVNATIHSEPNLSFDSRYLRFGIDSFTEPYSVYDYDVTARSLSLKDRMPCQHYDPAGYVNERIEIPAADGTSIPVSLVRRNDHAKNGAGPILLYGYGAYGTSIDPEFSPVLFSLVDRGIGYAVAHVRGGGELGTGWHKAGRGLKKSTGISDFIAVAQGLRDRGIAAPGLMAAMGQSAGGLLVAAAMNRQPDLFRAVVLQRPYLDLIGVLSDSDLPLTQTDRLEWGNPAQEPDRSNLLALSPLENIGRATYPEVLAICALNDPRTHYWETMSWAARLREAATPPLTPSVLVQAVGGHQGASDRFEEIDEWALIFAFLVDRLGGPYKTNASQ